MSKVRLKKKCVYMQSVHFSCPMLMKLDFFRQIFEKHENIKLREKFSGSRFVPCGKMDRRTSV